ncbi:non-hydrolyzing UDP-N-acetylglucosamine 2-epimerase [Sporohalobacter salinus]|uniref:non-hydrolyzing UDP-N-acetylglucosamine 2-epimerase n=1 Tax=Sporohalobacter salinus TaxID=1494606 RepID=UPI0030B828F2|nr:UDP-N-acetylglucosamine 2-epimerase (non-hydrolyzing) [Sporohalobacter salinus]
MKGIKKVAAVFGTRPEAIKMAPVIKELKNSSELELMVIITAQHRELLDQVLELFQLESDYDLNIMKEKQNLTQITSEILERLKPILKSEEFDLVLVHGDTTTSFASALASFYAQIPVGHVEAGLRTYNKYNPFPEEINRHLNGVLSELHFAPTEEAKRNLLQEGIAEKRVFVTGNTVIDALLEIFEPDYEFNQQELNRIDFTKKKLVLITAHRRENLGQPLVSICQAVKEIALRQPKSEIIFPVHPNPKVREVVNRILADKPNVNLIKPLDYKSFINLMARVDLILTDSGGIQEEAVSLGKPVLLLRETTERPEAVEIGTVELVGDSKELIIEKSLNLMEEKNNCETSFQAGLYGDGKAAMKIKRILFMYFNLMDDYH